MMIGEKMDLQKISLSAPSLERYTANPSDITNLLHLPNLTLKNKVALKHYFKIQNQILSFKTETLGAFVGHQIFFQHGSCFL